MIPEPCQGVCLPSPVLLPCYQDISKKDTKEILEQCQEVYRDSKASKAAEQGSGKSLARSSSAKTPAKAGAGGAWASGAASTGGAGAESPKKSGGALSAVKAAIGWRKRTIRKQ